MQKLSYEIYSIENQIVQDAYDSMITALHTSPLRPKTICVAGGEPGIGKTTISVNLAVSLAMTGRKTLLIDADIRKDVGNKRLSADGMAGLSEYLFSDVELDEVIAQTNIPSLHVLACGETSSCNPLGMLYSARFDNLLQTVKKEYDFVIFDTSPLSANSDPAVVATMTDGTFMVVTPDVSVDVYRKNIKKLRDMGVSIISVVFNKAPRSEYRSHMEFYSDRRLSKVQKKAQQRGKLNSKASAE